MHTPDALPQDAPFLGTAEHWTALRSPVFLKLRLQLVAMPLATHALGVLMRKPAASPISQPRLVVDKMVALVVTAPCCAVGLASSMLQLQ